MKAFLSDLLKKCEEGYKHAVLVYLDADGYPVSVATNYGVDVDRGVVKLRAPEGVAPADGARVNVIVSHIHPAPGVGYDQRRYIQFWGRVARSNGTLELEPKRGHTWSEHELPFVEYQEVSVQQGHEYLRRLSEEQGRPVKPKLSRGWLFLRATRLPFLSATFIPIALGVAAAAFAGDFHLGWALLTLLGGACIHLGLNTANDIFDTASGADAANTTPTQFSGGSRVVHYGLMTMRQLVALSASFYVAGIAIGLWLAVERGFWPLFWIGVAGVFVSVFYTAPPFRFVHRGVGEIMVALGFGPIMLLGAHYVQAQTFTWEAGLLSVPVAILIALVLYVNEIPDRRGDAAAGKRTLPVRWSKEAVIRAYAWSVAVAFAVIGGGAITGILPRPTIIALAALPLARKTVAGMREHYEDPYALMPFMGVNIKLHAFTGLLLLLGYVIAIVAQAVLDTPPAVLT